MVAGGLRVVGVCWRGVGEVFGVALWIIMRVVSFIYGWSFIGLFVFMFVFVY